MLRLSLAAYILAVGTVWGADPDGAALYLARCAGCHDNGADARVPKREEIASRTPESILATMFAGAMMVESAGLSMDQGRAIARFLTGKEPRTETASVTGGCTSPGKKVTVAATDWNGWGVDLSNSRYQPKPGLSAADIPKLKLKWAFGFEGATSAFAQPTVAGGRVFVGSQAGTVYSLDASAGCAYWSYSAGAPVRTAISLAKSGNRTIAFFGDIKTIVHGVDADTGEPIWKIKVEDHQVGRITGAPTFYNGRLYVPVSSIEEGSAALPQYECCTFRGSVLALDAETGRQIWKSYTVLDPPKPFKKNKTGVQMHGPAGAAVWSSPTIDTKRKLVYVATGDSYTDLDVDTTDAILAFDLDTGHLAWVSQVEANDNFIVSCPSAANCPGNPGPDFDFGSSPILRFIGGKEILVASQKSGIVWGLDPEQKGKILWQTRLGVGSMLGGVEWGSAADEQNAYVAISDRIVKSGGQPGISAVRLATGEKVWTTPAPAVTCATPAGCLPGQSAPVSVIPGAVFSGALNGHFRAYSTADGKILWDFDTVQPFDTVNKVEAKGGSIDGAGPTIANGMVFTTSGYGSFGGKPGNVLLAFSVDGK
ncbi:MAG: PQQ-binding-like beta-propeller repeat protein [Bryobacteraceae bacterium]